MHKTTAPKIIIRRPAASPVASSPAAAAHQNTPLSLVSQYYTLINGGHFDTAWTYLSPALQAQLGPFASWADGYSGSAATTLTEPISTTGDQLSADLAVGNVTYQGTWTVNSDVSLITSAHITQVSPATSPSVAEAPALVANGAPTLVGFSNDATNIFKVTGWTGWGSGTATATGTVIYEDCVPDCAGGIPDPLPGYGHVRRAHQGRVHLGHRAHPGRADERHAAGLPVARRPEQRDHHHPDLAVPGSLAARPERPGHPAGAFASTKVY